MNLSKLLDQEAERLSSDILNYNFEDFSHYIAWAAQHYRLIQNTPHLLHLCTANVDVQNIELFDEFEHHLEEEKKHDVMLLNDTKKLGVDITTHPISTPVHTIIDLQHYYINKYGPLVFLGYGLLLEGITYKVGKIVADRIATAHKGRSVFLDIHVKSDDTHYPDGMQRIDNFIQDEISKKMFLRNLKISSFNYSRLLEEASVSAQLLKGSQAA
ncbi:MAG: hypothetical protein ACRBBP_02000 [Bdellovibrionales bacterium]